MIQVAIPANASASVASVHRVLSGVAASQRRRSVGGRWVEVEEKRATTAAPIESAAPTYNCRKSGSGGG